MTPQAFAITRIERVATRARTENSSDDLTGWLLSSIQRWWLSHSHLLDIPQVAQSFCDAIGATLPHLEHALLTQARARGFISSIRDAGPGVYSDARALVTLLGLDPDPSVQSLLVDEWRGLPIAVAGETSLEIATHGIALVNQTINVIADPETTDAQRIDLIDLASTTLADVAQSQAARSDLWLAIADINHRWRDDEALARLARLALSCELLDLIRRDASQHRAADNHAPDSDDGAGDQR